MTKGKDERHGCDEFVIRLKIIEHEEDCNNTHSHVFQRSVVVPNDGPKDQVTVELCGVADAMIRTAVQVHSEHRPLEKTWDKPSNDSREGAAKSRYDWWGPAKIIILVFLVAVVGWWGIIAPIIGPPQVPLTCNHTDPYGMPIC